MRTQKLLTSIAVVTVVAVLAILVSKSKEIEIPVNTGAVSKTSIIPASAYQEDKIKQLATQPAVKDLATKIASDILEKNPTGPAYSDLGTNAASIVTDNPDALADKILKDQSAKIADTILNPEIDEKAFIISGSEPMLNYLIARQKVIDSAARKLVGFNIQKMDDDGLALIIRTGEEAAKELMRVTVPTLAVSIHKEQLRLVLAQLAIFKAIRNREQDPVTAAISISFFSKIQEDSKAFEAILLEAAIKAGLPSKK
jgi:hypothetical protein